MARGQKLKLLAGRSSQKLARAIAKELGLKLSRVEIGNFADGEINVRLEESVRGANVFIIQSHAPLANESIMEQALLIDAAKRAGADQITAVCPYLGYSRQDRLTFGREPVAAKLVVDILAQAGADRLMAAELHSEQIQGFFDRPFDNIKTSRLLAESLENLGRKNLVVVSPDTGRVKLAKALASRFGCDFAVIHKHRPARRRNSARAKQLMGDVSGKTCLVIDDIIDTASTLTAAAKILEKNGAEELYAAATHGLFSAPAVKLISSAAFKKIYVTDTVAPQLKSTKIKIIPAAPLIAAAIKNSLEP